jgi:hypothetical protein
MKTWVYPTHFINPQRELPTSQKKTETCCGTGAVWGLLPNRVFWVGGLLSLLIWKQKSSLHFCQECNLIYPKADPQRRIMVYRCRICQYDEHVDNKCVYRNDLLTVTKYVLWLILTILHEHIFQGTSWYHDGFGRRCYTGMIFDTMNSSRFSFPCRLTQRFHAHAVGTMSQYRLSAFINFSAVPSSIKMNQNERRRG